MHPEPVEAGVLHVAVVGEDVELDHLEDFSVVLVLDLKGLQRVAVSVIDVPEVGNRIFTYISQ